MAIEALAQALSQKIFGGGAVRFLTAAVSSTQRLPDAAVK
jgi:hypothetical protein